MHDPVQSCTHQEDDIGFFQRQASCGTNRQRVVVVHDTLAHRRGQERQLCTFDKAANLFFRTRIGHALADDDQWLLCFFQKVQRFINVFRHRLDPGRFRNARGCAYFGFVDFTKNDVIGHVEITRARTAINGVPDSHFDIERNTFHVLDIMRELAVRGCQFGLTFFLERAHAVLIHRRCAADQNHRPEIFLGIRQPRQRHG